MKLFLIFISLFIMSCDQSIEEELSPYCTDNILQYYPQNRLINGRETSLFPEVCRLSCNGATCSGVLIGKRTILTAKHCFEYCDGKMVVIFNNSIVIDIYKSILHDKHDIAIGILDKEVNINPRKISSSPPIIGDDLLLFGFGYTNPHGSSTVMPRYGCNVVDNVTEHTIHFSSIDKDSGIMCYGDSGGPMYINGLLAGIHSHCIDCEIIDNSRCGNGTNVDIRVDSHLDWILENTKDFTSGEISR